MSLFLFLPTNNEFEVIQKTSQNSNVQNERTDFLVIISTNWIKSTKYLSTTHDSELENIYKSMYTSFLCDIQYGFRGNYSQPTNQNKCISGIAITTI